MRLITKAAFGVAASVLTLTAAGAIAQDYSWQPDRPINLIVPWGAGGSTDQVIRVTAPVVGEALGVDVVVVNQPGASGAIGTQEVLNASRDGYTWASGAIGDASTYAVTGLIPGTSIDDWHVYLSVANVAVVGVAADSEFEDFGQLLDAFRERGANITVATAGVGSSGGTAIAAIADQADFDYNMITYDGGNPAVIATASGEAMLTTQLAVEQVEMIRGGRMRGLAVLANEPLVVAGVDPIPPITDWLPDMPLAMNYFGIFLPVGVPDELVETMDQIWADEVANSESLRTYAESFGAVYAPLFGDEARAAAMPIVIDKACAAVQRGEAVIDPSEIGIDCETRSQVGAN